MAGPWEQYQEQGPWQRYGQQKPAELTADPTDGMSTFERILAGVGRGMTSAGRATLQGLSGLVGANRVGAGLVSDADVAEAKRTDAPLMNTTAGKVGNVLGSAAVAAPTAFIPGANTYTGAALLGAGVGGLTTEGGLEDRARGAAWGAAGGAAGKGLGDALGAGSRFLADKVQANFAARQAADAQKVAAAQAARDAGYVIPPADVPNAGAFTELMSGLSGKIKTAQVASQRNQGATNELARKALGIADDAPLTQSALRAMRSEAATTGYAPIRSAGEVVADNTYGKALDKIASQYQGAARSFPGAAKNPVLDMVESLRQPKFDAGDAIDMVKVLRETADKAYRSGDTGLGKASKEASQALEEQIGRFLEKNGSADALAAFREARKAIAKTYSVGKALNEQTGDVSAQALSAQLAKGKPLSDELLQIAQIAQAFPKATQALKETPKSTSPLDWAMGTITGASTGSPLGLLTLGARPAARSLLLSSPYQRAMLSQPSGPGLLSQAPAALLDQELTRAMFPGLLGMEAAQLNAR